VIILAALLPVVAAGQDVRVDGVAVQQMQKFDRFFGLLSATYINEVDAPKLVEAAIKGTLAQLDPHSVYFSAEEMKEQTETFQGNFSGVGLAFNVMRDTITVVNVTPEGPSEKAGLLPNDRIVEIDGETAVGISQSESQRRMRGERGTTVVFGVLRGGRRLEFNVVRDNIPLTTLDAAYLVDRRTGYLRVNRFAQTTMEEFREAMARFGKIDGLVLDLRGNAGGYVHMAIDMANYFLDEGNVIVSTEGRFSGTEIYRADRRGEMRKGRLVVLVDELSASASEIVSGALQDWDRAVIVGRRSFGKGLVQQQFMLQDGSAARITVAQYVTPTGRHIQRPFEMGHKDDYYQALAERISKGDTAVSDSLQAYKTLRLGKTVYGGGGITPDYYVPVDTTDISAYYKRLSGEGAVGRFLLDYLSRNRASLEAKYPTFEAYDASFEADSRLIDELVEAAKTQGIEPDEAGLAQSRELLSVQIKAYLAARLWEDGDYFRVFNPRRDDVYGKALEIMANWDKMARGVVVM
jgi:carboxyl-terminal processing protease